MNEDIDITIRITPDSAFNPPFDWEFKVNNGAFHSFPGAVFFRLSNGKTANVTMTLETGMEGDTVAFSNDTDALRITVQEEDSKISVPVPVPFNKPVANAITFFDANVVAETWHVKLFVTYHDHIADADIPLVSPDPTIVNDGTGMDYPSERQAKAPQVQAQSA